MGKNVVIIDYQLGNLFSVQQACEYLGHKAIVSHAPEVLLKADYVILPGVGAFKDAMDNLKKFGLYDAILEYVRSGKPFMGVCLGLQLLLTESEEFGTTQGLNLIPGKVKKFRTQQEFNSEVLKVPQIQWNTISVPENKNWKNSPLDKCQPGDFMYFVHSYYAAPESEEHVLSKTNYGNLQYCSSVLKDNVFATQFHPEKSGLHGVAIYQEWFNQF